MDLFGTHVSIIVTTFDFKNEDEKTFDFKNEDEKLETNYASSDFCAISIKNFSNYYYSSSNSFCSKNYFFEFLNIFKNSFFEFKNTFKFINLLLIQKKMKMKKIKNFFLIH
jgi:hypothetical protein